MKPPPIVDDEETLFRRILDREDILIRDGRYVASSQAFGDAGAKPSVDRKALCVGGAKWTQQAPGNGVLSVVATDVRAIDNVKSAVKERGKPAKDVRYKFDVVWRPEKDNEAHSQIEPAPDWATKSAFKRLLERLARLAHVEILPLEHRGPDRVCGHCAMQIESPQPEPDAKADAGELSVVSDQHAEQTKTSPERAHPTALQSEPHSPVASAAPRQAPRASDAVAAGRHGLGARPIAACLVGAASMVGAGISLALDEVLVALGLGLVSATAFLYRLNVRR